MFLSPMHLPRKKIVSSIPEYKPLCNDRNRKLETFDHRDVSVQEELSHLDFNSTEIESTSRLGKFNAANITQQI